MLFRDRSHAGELLARRLEALRGYPNLVVLALPRGGVPVALPLARSLQAPWDVFLVRKLGVPGQPELAFGALALGGVRVINADVVRGVGLTRAQQAAVERAAAAELQRRERLFSPGPPDQVLRGRTVLLVDDGLATGATMRAAITAAQAYEPAGLWVVVPVGPRRVVEQLRGLVDEVICLECVDDLLGVGAVYDVFDQVEEATVCELLAARDPVATLRCSAKSEEPTP